MSGYPTDNQAFNAFVWSIGQQETGSYKDQYTVPPNSSGAAGKYQLTYDNVAAWSKEVLGRTLSESEYLSSPQLQEQIARTKLWEYYSKYGAAGAAAMWYSGQPNPNAGFGHPSVAQYVSEVLARAKSAPASAQQVGTTGGASPTDLTNPVGGLLQIPQEILQPFSEAYKLMVAFFQPSTYVRLTAGSFGVLLFIIGLWVLGKVAFHGNR